MNPGRLGSTTPGEAPPPRSRTPSNEFDASEGIRCDAALGHAEICKACRGAGKTGFATAGARLACRTARRRRSRQTLRTRCRDRPQDGSSLAARGPQVRSSAELPAPGLRGGRAGLRHRSSLSPALAAHVCDRFVEHGDVPSNSGFKSVRCRAARGTRSSRSAQPRPGRD